MKKIFHFFAGIGLGAAAAYTITNYFKPVEDVKVDKFKSYYNMLSKWLELEEEGKSVDKLLQDAGYKKIAIYGMGNIGKRLCKVLKDTDISIEYGIDNFVVEDVDNVCIKCMDDVLPKVDAIVVTVPFAYIDIKKSLENKVEYPIVSLEHILFEV